MGWGRPGREGAAALLGRGGGGGPFRFPETGCEDASLGRTQDQDRKWGSEKRSGERGKECHTSTASCKEEPGPLECATTVTLPVTPRAAPRPRRLGQLGALSGYSLR